MPNHNGHSTDGAHSDGNGQHKGEIRKQNVSLPPELLALATDGLDDAQAQIEHDKWKSKKALDDVVGKDTDKWLKRFCVADVVAYHDAVKFAEDKPNAQAIKELARRTALSGLSKLFPNISRDKLSQLLEYKPEELEEP